MGPSLPHASACRFVFCDNGTKKHPKIYGFSSLDAAARAFDILTCKRALEKGRTVAGILAAVQVRPLAKFVHLNIYNPLENGTKISILLQHVLGAAES